MYFVSSRFFFSSLKTKDYSESAFRVVPPCFPVKTLLLCCPSTLCNSYTIAIIRVVTSQFCAPLRPHRHVEHITETTYQCSRTCCNKPLTASTTRLPTPQCCRNAGDKIHMWKILNTVILSTHLHHYMLHDQKHEKRHGRLNHVYSCFNTILHDVLCPAKHISIY